MSNLIHDIIISIIKSIEKNNKRKLSKTEKIYIIKSCTKILSNTHDEDLRSTISILIDELSAEITNIDNNDVLDIKEIMLRELKKKTMVIPQPPKEILQCNIASIFSTVDRRTLLHMFNPMMNMYTVYTVLDRKYCDSTDNINFKWNVSDTSAYNGNNKGALTNKKIKNVISIIARSFQFPSTSNALQFQNKISLSIKELAHQGMIFNETGRRFHFIYNIRPETNGTLTLLNAINETNEFVCYGVIQTLSTISISFGNPYHELQLDPDRLSADITPQGVETLITFTQPHNLSINDYITIQGFKTSSPNTDSVEINLINDPTGWVVSSLTATTVNILVDLSQLKGSIVSNPIMIYLESKRFIIPMIVKCIHKII